MSFWSSAVFISTSPANSSYKCKFQFDTDSYFITGYDITVSYLSSGDELIVYLEESDAVYTQKAKLDDSGDSATVRMSSRGTYNDMFIVLIPSGGAYASFSVSHRTDLSTSTTSSTSLSAGGVVGIIIASIVIVVICIGLSVLLRYLRRKRMRGRIEVSNAEAQNINQNQNNAVIITPQPQPQPMIMESQPMIMQPQPLYNPNYANMYPNQSASNDPIMPAHPADSSINCPQGVPITKANPPQPVSSPDSQPLVLPPLAVNPSKNQATYYQT